MSALHPNDLPDELIDLAVAAQWDAIPCHVPFADYIANHKDRETILPALRKHMRAALAALGKP